jgi:hypothetical protein
MVTDTMRFGVNAAFFEKPETGIGVVTREFLVAFAKLPASREHEWIWYFPAGDRSTLGVGMYPSCPRRPSRSVHGFSQSLPVPEFLSDH